MINASFVNMHGRVRISRSCQRLATIEGWKIRADFLVILAEATRTLTCCWEGSGVLISRTVFVGISLEVFMYYYYQVLLSWLVNDGSLIRKTQVIVA